MFNDDNKTDIDDIIDGDDNGEVIDMNHDPADLEVEVGTDTGAIGELEDAPTYPIKPNEHIGVSTNHGTKPEATDEGAEPAEVVWGTPDDVKERDTEVPEGKVIE